MSWFLAETAVGQEFLKAQDRWSLAGGGSGVLYSVKCCRNPDPTWNL